MGRKRVTGNMAMTTREHEFRRQITNAGDGAHAKTAKALEIEPDTIKKHLKSVSTNSDFSVGTEISNETQ